MATTVERVLCWGDSMMTGFAATNHYGWVDMLRRDFLTANEGRSLKDGGAFFYNLAVFGDKAEHIAARVEHEAQARLRPIWGRSPNPSQVLSVVSTGINDAWLHPETSKPVTPLDTFAHHVGAIAATLGDVGKLLYVGLPSCDETLYGDAYNKSQHWQYESFVEYEGTAADIFRRAGALTAPLTQLTQYNHQYFEGISEDSLHPTDQGEYWIYGHVRNAFQHMIK